MSTRKDRAEKSRPSQGKNATTPAPVERKPKKELKKYGFKKLFKFLNEPDEDADLVEGAIYDKNYPKLKEFLTNVMIRTMSLQRMRLLEVVMSLQRMRLLEVVMSLQEVVMSLQRMRPLEVVMSLQRMRLLEVVMSLQRMRLLEVVMSLQRMRITRLLEEC